MAGGNAPGGRVPRQLQGKGAQRQGRVRSSDPGKAQPGGEKLEGVEQKGKKLACRRGKGQNTALAESNPT